jgi:hypothetical protein
MRTAAQKIMKQAWPLFPMVDMPLPGVRRSTANGSEVEARQAGSSGRSGCSKSTMCPSLFAQPPAYGFLFNRGKSSHDAGCSEKRNSVLA